MINQELAFIFPGQGSQTVGMLADLARRYSEIETTFANASAVLGYDLWALAQNGPQDELNLTEKTQPLLLASSVAIWRIWQAQGGRQPGMMAGHSLGEYSALVCSDVIAFEDAVGLVRKRGQFMQSAVPVGVGAMAAVLGLDDSSIVEICAAQSSEGSVVEAVNFNSPGQVVIAGNAAAVATAGDALKKAGAKRVAPLPVSAPFHTSLMRPAGVALALELEKINFARPSIPIVHNVHAQTETEPEKIRQLMIEQTSSPVQWTRCVELMVAQGVKQVCECGPGKVLSGLVRRIHKPLQAMTTDNPDVLAAALQQS